MCRIHKTPAAAWLLTAMGCAALILLFSAELSAQCAMCRTALTQSAEGQRWSRGINAGIALLLIAPFAIAGAGLLMIYRARVGALLRSLRARLFRNSSGEPRVAISPLTDR